MSPPPKELLGPSMWQSPPYKGHLDGSQRIYMYYMDLCNIATSSGVHLGKSPRGDKSTSEDIFGGGGGGGGGCAYSEIPKGDTKSRPPQMKPCSYIALVRG